MHMEVLCLYCVLLFRIQSLLRWFRLLFLSRLKILLMFRLPVQFVFLPQITFVEILTLMLDGLGFVLNFFLGLSWFRLLRFCNLAVNLWHNNWWMDAMGCSLRCELCVFGMLRRKHQGRCLGLKPNWGLGPKLDLPRLTHCRWHVFFISSLNRLLNLYFWPWLRVSDRFLFAIIFTQRFFRFTLTLHTLNHNRRLLIHTKCFIIRQPTKILFCIFLDIVVLIKHASLLIRNVLLMVYKTVVVVFGIICMGWFFL